MFRLISTAPTTAADVLVSVYYGGRSKQLQIPSDTRWEHLVEQLKYEFTLGELFVKYVDEEGDEISLDSQGEFEEALRVVDTTGVLRLNITSTPVAPTRQPPCPSRPPPTSPRPKGHYAELARTVGQEQKRLAREQPQPKPLRVIQLPLPSRPTPVSPRPKGHYAELARTVGQEQKKMTSEQPEPKPQRVIQPPQWFSSALEAQSQTVILEMQKSLDGVVDMLTTARDSAHPCCAKGTPTGPAHFQIECDNCSKSISGVRYKCGNCSDYDLCETCEVLSDRIHPPDHVFLKIKTPVLVAKDKRSRAKPLLRMNLYRPSHTSDDEEMHCAAPPPVKFPPTTEHSSKYRAAARPYVVKPRDKLREDLKVAKKRRKDEKLKRKFEARQQRFGMGLTAGPSPHASLEDDPTLAGSGSFKLPDIYYDSPPKAGMEVTEVAQQKGHGKYLDAVFLHDSCYPDGSLIPIGMEFEKGWVIKNSGTKKWKHVKLVYQEGLKPTQFEVDVPELKPGEQAEVKVQYPAISPEEPDSVKSSWRLIHKLSTPFGPPLWLSVEVDKEPLHLPPPTLPQLPPLSNDNLLKSIGFLPDELDTVPPPQGSFPPPDPSEPSAPYLADILAPPPDSEPGDGEESFVPVSRQSSIASDELLRTFEMVRAPEHSVRSLSSNDSLHQSPPMASGQEEREDLETASLGSGDNLDDFVVVIPECFNLDVPLTDYTPLHLRKKEATPTSSLDIHVTSAVDNSRDQDSDVEVLEAPPTAPPTSNSGVPPPLAEKPLQQSPPVPTQPEAMPQASPPTTRRPLSQFVPEKPTLQTVRDSGCRAPFFIAAGVVNTLTGFVEERMRFKPEPKPQDLLKTEEESDNEDLYEDAPEAPSSSPDIPETTPTEPAPAPEQPPSYSRQSSTPWVKHQQDVRNLLPSEEDDSKWVQDRDVSHLVDRKWEGPPRPLSPVDQLVAMGFANRQQNERLLKKHKNQLQAVINELLDFQRQNTHV